MTDNYSFPITPPPELVREWMERTEYDEHTWFYESYIAERAAQWGADQELEACCLWLNGGSKIDYDTAALLRAARRPKSPSLKEQALLQLDVLNADLAMHGLGTDLSQIRRALEQLPDNK
jgi:hypothetical protein